MATDTSKFAGSAGGGRYQNAGVGNSEMTQGNLTIPGRFPDDNLGAGRTQGETSGAGSIYAATIVERPQAANTRNGGPERVASRAGSSALPVASMATRKTGRVG